MQDLLRFRPNYDNEKQYYFNDYRTSFGHFLEHNRVRKCYELLQTGARPSIKLASKYCCSREMCILLLLHGIEFDVYKVRPSVYKTLIYNGFDLHNKYTRGAVFRNSYCSLRKRIVTLIGIKKYRNVLLKIDRFVIREIALAMYAERYDFVDSKLQPEPLISKDISLLMRIMICLLFAILYYKIHVF